MGEIKAELNAELQTHIAFEIPLFGGIPVPESAVVSWAIIVVLTLFSIWLTHGLRKRPGRKQIAAEMLVGFINNFCRDTLGDKYWRTFAPYLGTVGLYLALANMAGLFGFTPPTKDLNVTAGLAIMSALLIYGSQFRFHGLRGGLKKFSEPVSVVTPLNIMEIGIRPLSLCMRLFGNIFAGFMELVKMAIPVVVPIPLSLYFDVFDGMIQAIVFVFLTTLFLSESLE